jgi:serine/threonine protein kinase/Flp pilus assembly protein TadD
VEKPEQWEKIKEIVGAALERDPSQRPAFLNAACSTDKALRAEVESLLSAHASADGLSESALTQTFGFAGQVAKSVGPYLLVQKLGEGGMGQVWLAEQTAPVRRKVALKLIKSGIYDDSVLRRFQSERQSLAIMDHPAIAKVFDAGATQDGHPYFVMEYVPGVAITDYCDQKKLKIRARLQLFLHACEGVQHAHQKAIIHRDLKPANILVVEVDGTPAPRIIDFGLAKPVTPFVSGETMNTRMGAFVGTPGYMSPEQIDPSVEDVDTRTDVYSLGVVLYELLTGFLPFDAERLRKMKLEEVLRHLREEDPPSPSTKVSADRKTSSSRAEARGTEPRQLSSALRGDLDWIAMKALEKERNRRYGTPSELAADIGRYLNNEPVAARPASKGYRLRKYVRRHRVGVTVAAGFALLLVGFAGAQAVQLRRTTRERDRADREAAAAKSVSDFLTGLFKVSSPSEARGNSITAREILDQGRTQIETSLASQPEVQARLIQTMGEVYASLGLYEQSRPLFEKAVETRRRVLGPEHPDTLTSMDFLARNLERQGHGAEAEALARETLEARSRVLGPEHPDTIGSMHDLAAVLLVRGRYAEAEKLTRQVLDVSRRVRGPEHPDTLKSMDNLALSLMDQGRNAEAERIYRGLLEIQRRVLGPDHPDTLLTMTSLARAVSEEGGYSEAGTLLRETLDTKRRVLGPEHSETLWSMHDLGVNLRNAGQPAEAEKIDRETLEIRRRVLGPQHPETLMSMGELAESLDDLHRYAEAEKLYRQAVDIQSRVLGPEHPEVALTKYNLACNLALQGHRDEALAFLRDAVDHGLPSRGPGLEQDSDLQSLHGDPRFDAVVADRHQRAAAPKAH